jgi:hypothetical protein
MSWHTSGTLIHADYSKDLPGLLEKLGVEGANLRDATISFEEATSVEIDGLGVAVVDGWTCLFGTMTMVLIDDEALARISKEADVFQITLEGSSGAAGFEWMTGGKSVRRWMIVEGDVTVNEGTPLPQEKLVANEKDDEQRMLLLMEKMTVPFKRLSETKFHAFECESELGDMEW